MCTGEEGLLLVEVHLHNKVMHREIGGENVKFQFEGLSVTCEDDLCRLVERINNDPEFAKQLEKYGIKDEQIEVREAIRIYHEKLKKLGRKKFRKEHECIDCADYFLKSCKGLPPCKYEEDFQREKKGKHEKAICPMDKTGDCPYGRPEGICIGLPSCYRDLIEKFRGGNGRNEPSKEDSGNG